MITAGVGLALSAVRTWTRLYTWGLPAELRDARRDEIESDLWESVVDAGRQDQLALQIWGRLLGGIVDDLGWRSDHGALPLSSALRIAAMLALVAIMGALLIQAVTAPLPAAPPTPRYLGEPQLLDPPPPPPPPPPCPPPGFPSDRRARCTK